MQSNKTILGILILMASLGPPIHGSSACTIRQLTRTKANSGGVSAISADGKRILLVSSDDFTGKNGDGSSEIFLLDLPSGQIEQLTDVPKDPIVDPITEAELDQFSLGLTASQDLGVVLFASKHDLVGQNPNRQLEHFLFFPGAREFEQITHASGCPGVCSPPDINSVGPARLSRDGKWVALQMIDSRIDVVDEIEVPVVLGDVFLYSVEDDTILQITHAQPNYELLQQDETFVPISFTLDGSELVLVERSSGAYSLYNRLTGETASLASLAQQVDSVQISPHGSDFLLSSRLDLTGENPDGSPELFLYQRGSGELEQITNLRNDLTTEEIFNRRSFSDDGSAILYLTQTFTYDSPFNPLQQTRSAMSLFRYDRESRMTARAAYTVQKLVFDDNGTFVGPEGNFFLTGAVDASSDGTRLAFASRVDLTGDNPEQTAESYLLDCQDVVSRYFAQVGDGSEGDLEFGSDFVFTNTGEAATVQLDFFDSDGAPWKIDLGGLGSRSSFRFQIRGGESIQLSTGGGDEPLRSGYARVVAPGEVGGSAILKRADRASGQVLYEAGIPFSESLAEFTIPIETGGNRDTGLALVVPASQAVETAGSDSLQVHLQLYDSAYKLLGERVVELDPGQHMARFVGQLFPEAERDAGAFTGALVGVADRTLAVLALRQEDSFDLKFPDSVPSLTALPVFSGRPQRNEVPFISLH